MLVISEVFAYVQSHQIVHIKYMQLYINYPSIKLLRKFNFKRSLGAPQKTATLSGRV